MPNETVQQTAREGTDSIATKNCSLCDAPAAFLFSATVLHKHQVNYFQCPRCDLIQTEFPYWLAEAPWMDIAPWDTGCVERSLLCRRLTLAVNYCLELTNGARCLDYGGGSGLFVRMMRDAGFNFRWQDKYATNVFAQGFEAELDRKYNLVTCFEVFEHLPDVSVQLDVVFRQQHDFIFVSTLLHEGHQGGWWYYCHDAGGHVSFYSRKSMEWIADRYGYIAICGPAFTLFAKSSIPLSTTRRGLLMRVINGSRLAGLLDCARPKFPALTERDNIQLRERPFRTDRSRAELNAEKSACAVAGLRQSNRILLGIIELAAAVSCTAMFRWVRSATHFAKDCAKVLLRKRRRSACAL